MNAYTIVDARSLLLHSYFRCSAGSSEGSFTTCDQALSQFIKDHLVPMLRAARPRQIIACFDGGNESRSSMYLGYKQRRKQRDKEENPEALAEQREYLKTARRLMAYLGIRTVHVPGEEADDLIALLASKLDADTITILSRDNDLLQLANERVIVQRIDKVYGLLPGLLQDFDGIPFNLIPIYKAIVGEKDEVPGVKGCGDAFFKNLLETFGGEGMAWLAEQVRTGRKDLLEQVGAKQINTLLEQWDSLRLSLRLATVNPDFCYGRNRGSRKVPEWLVRVPNAGIVFGYLSQLGLNELWPEWEGLFPTETLITAHNSPLLQRVVAALQTSPVVSYDFESSDKLQHPAFREKDKDFVDVMAQELAGISINYGDNLQHTVYLSFDHKDEPNLTLDWAKWILQVLHRLPQRPVVQNANFELSVTMMRLGLEPITAADDELRAPYDTKIMASYVDEEMESGLKRMSKEWLNYNQASYMETTQGRPMCELTGEEVLSYGCDDSLVTSHLFDVFRIILQCEGTWDFYKDNEVDWAIDNAAYFLHGTDIDFAELDRVRLVNSQTIEASMKLMHSELAEYCNTSHTDQTIYNRAAELLKEWWVLESTKYDMQDPEQVEKAKARYALLWERALLGCRYTPPQVIQELNFLPTAKWLNLVSQSIDTCLPVLKTVSKRSVEAWAAEATEALRHEQSRRTVSERAGKFVKLLYEARFNLAAKQRQGDAYEDLKEFCVDALTAAGFAKRISSGDQLNVGSTDQMQCLLYGKLQLPIRRRSKSAYGSKRKRLGLPGAPATGVKAVAAAFVYDVVEDDDWRMPLLRSYLDVVHAEQELTLYCNGYPLFVHPYDGRIHPQINNCGTKTRRPSGTAPNCLQVSKKGERLVRRTFRAGDYGDGLRVYFCSDFSGQEIFITAFESQDPVMMAAFTSEPRQDIHSLTMSAISSVVLPKLGVVGDCQLTYEEVLHHLHGQTELTSMVKSGRNTYAKPANFLIIYGGGYTTLAENLLIPGEFAKSIMEAIFQRYGRLRTWQQESIEFAQTHGYCLTAYGSRRHAPEGLWSDDKGVASRAGRQLINSQVQGGAADILKVALTDMRRRKMRERYALRALKPVYDEISASIPIDLVVPYSQELQEVMEITPPGYPVPLRVDTSIGLDWGEQFELKNNEPETVAEAVEFIKIAATCSNKQRSNCSHPSNEKKRCDPTLCPLLRN